MPRWAGADPPCSSRPEWCAVAAVAVLDAVWARAIGFHLVVTPRDFLQIGAGLGIAGLMMMRRWKRPALFAEYFALTAAATCAFAVLSYLALASSGPLQGRHAAADRPRAGF